MAQGGRRHFDNDVRRGIFSFTEPPWRELLQHRLQTDHVDEVRAQRTRIRSHVHVSDHGGYLHQIQIQCLCHTKSSTNSSIIFWILAISQRSTSLTKSYMRPTLIYFAFVSATTVTLNESLQVSLALAHVLRKTSIATSCPFAAPVPLSVPPLGTSCGVPHPADGNERPGLPMGLGLRYRPPGGRAT